MAIELIEQVVLTSQSGSVTFSNIPQDGKELIIKTHTFHTTTNAGEVLYSSMKLNNNWRARALNWYNSAFADTSAQPVVEEYIGLTTKTSNPQDYSYNEVRIADYALSKGKNYNWLGMAGMDDNNNQHNAHGFGGGSTGESSPITTLEWYLSERFFAVGSTFSLYKTT